MYFLPKDYEAPKPNSDYMKMQDGENKFRILSEPILGWEDWTPDLKPVRYRYTEEKPSPMNESRPVKHFWAMIVWNYRENRIQILQITQNSLRDGLMKLIYDKEWGDPYHYDIKVLKSGKDKMTKYGINPSPHKPVSIEIEKAFNGRPICLDKLFEGENPFSCSPSEATPGCFRSPRLNDRDSGYGYTTPSPFGPYEELKELLEVDAIPTERLDEWIKLRCQTKNEKPETIIQACLSKDILPKFKKSFAKWLEGGQKEAVAF